MANNKSDISRYESRYGGGFITPAQYIAEFMCERVAEHNQTKLSQRFWKLPEWQKYFVYQVGLANKILGLIQDVKLIIMTLRACPYARSLNAPHLKKALETAAKASHLKQSLGEASRSLPEPTSEATPFEQPRKIKRQNPLEGLE